MIALFHSKKFILCAILILVIIGGIVTATVLVTRPDYMTIRALAGNDTEQRRASDYKGSKLWLHKNGTFSFQVVYRGNNEFVGIGTWKKVGKKAYAFEYQDMYRIIGDNNVLQRDNAKANWTPNPYSINKKGQIELRDPDNKLYYFK
ncbi:MAG: hypothetical protein LBG88_01595 [Christensenellaceae bacterium]|jgi:hypothetical protein|nr:hypothetical protein [Christensenellaceae bacterium]